MSTDDNVTTFTETCSAVKITGRVKWFNNKAGYGFITVTDTDQDKNGSDIFVHHSSIGVLNQQYKYLVQGEYVNFNLVKTENDKHEYQAADVSGINGGKLMCETRRDFKIARSSYKDNEKDEGSELDMPIQKKVYNSKPRVRGEGPRGKDHVVEKQSDKAEWTLVKNTQDRKTVSGRGRGRPPRSVQTDL